MEGIRVLWFSNRVFETVADDKSGTWLTTLGPALVKTGKITLANISTSSVNEITKSDSGCISQWLIPEIKIGKKGIPTNSIITGIQQICDKFKPDVIHIWGTENYWGLLTARCYVKGNIVLSIQGILSSIAPVFYGGLSFVNRLKCIGIRELVYPKQSIFLYQKKIKNSIKREKEIIQGHKYIISQSNWVKFQVENLNNNVVSFHTERALRGDFFNCKKWTDIHKKSRTAPVLFTTSLPVPYKGLHVLIKALAILRSRFPLIKLIVAGQFTEPGIKQSGYERWLHQLMVTNKVYDLVSFVGSLNAQMLSHHLGQSDVFINPSFVESYSLTVAEAMAVGTPATVSFAGAMPELLGNDDTALYFSPGDHVACAMQIDRLLNDFDFSRRASERMQKIAIIRNNLDSIVANQLKIYQHVIDNTGK